MPGASEVRKRERRAREAAAMTAAAAELRRRGVGFAGLDDEESVDATAALLEAIAGGGVEVTARVWEQATRTAERVSEARAATSSDWSGPAGPSPKGHRPPRSERTGE